ncbi:hypothetical protein KDW_52610 [Dictyobacter vulcani]|uniref:Response regulatory domain-containing protein n=1 Tax=Dictyobacter vulcani TaxID=2607529 RepID=A0A5J4KY73_9CHLR|nr:response regulator [Dictyobacter vulcani]GER91099.1 hypothetical protein KDW_52610 [Dictyobacter vulcani]
MSEQPFTNAYTQPETANHNLYKTLLVVEDDQSIGETIIQVIDNETSYHATLATDARQALEIIQKIKPNGILLDYQLPYMNGIQFYDRLHAVEDYKDIPIILMSANLPYKEIQQRQMQTLKKPFELDELVEVIEHCLGE